MPNYFSCYLNSFLKINVTRSYETFTKTGILNNSRSLPLLWDALDFFQFASFLPLSSNYSQYTGFSNFSISVYMKGSPTLGGTLFERPSEDAMLSLWNKFRVSAAAVYHREKCQLFLDGEWGSLTLPWASPGRWTTSPCNWEKLQGEIVLLLPGD